MTKLARLWSTARRTGMAALCAASAGGLLFLNVAGKAQPPDAGTTKTVQGTVRNSTTAPMGEIDGAVLDDGTVIHWPPHLGDRMSGIAIRGDQIRATGWMETGPEGDTHFEVRSITNLRTRASLANEEPAPPPPPGRALGRRRGPIPPPPPGPRSAGSIGTNAVRTLQGTVQRLTTAPMGEFDGAVLDDGTVIHWPPHLVDRFSAVIARGDQVKVSGWTETGPAGDTHFEVQSATNLRTGATFGVDDGAPIRTFVAESTADGSTDFTGSASRSDALERRLKALEDQISQLREEIRLLRAR